MLSFRRKSSEVFKLGGLLSSGYPTTFFQTCSKSGAISILRRKHIADVYTNLICSRPCDIIFGGSYLAMNSFGMMNPLPIR